MNIIDEFDFEKLDYQPIKKEYVKVMYFNTLWFGLIMGIGLGVFFYFNDVEWYTWAMAYLGVLVLMILKLIYNRAEIKNRLYFVGNQFVVYRSGLFLLTTEIVPFSRIQHTSLNQGWLSKKLGLASVSVFTAGNDDTSIKIKGLSLDEAKKMNSFILNHLEE
ncbi:MAG: hypothetical protein CSA38_04840 [Flavobacteriales bacterium]|nr:MAG: hypothetical protein CSA38_04840 [Flavobacteriales bacterium]